jgi:hypothetical protein
MVDRKRKLEAEEDLGNVKCPELTNNLLNHCSYSINMNWRSFQSPGPIILSQLGNSTAATSSRDVTLSARHSINVDLPQSAGSSRRQDIRRTARSADVSS